MTVKFVVQHAQDRMSVVIFKKNESGFFHHNSEGEEVFLESGGIGPMIPWFEFSSLDFNNLLEAMIKTNTFRIEGADKAELTATKRHLEDMRSLVFGGAKVEVES